MAGWWFSPGTAVSSTSKDKENWLLVSPNIGKILRAGRQAGFFSLFFSQEILQIEVLLSSPWRSQNISWRFCYANNFASLLFRLINTNISVNEQPEWFHWAQRRWTFYTYCTSRTRFRSWSFYRYRKHFGNLNQSPWHVEKISKKTRL